jgi:protein TonB
MKKLLILVLICFAQNIFSQTITKDYKKEIPPHESIPSNNQETTEDDNSTFTFIETTPEFPGGQKEFNRFIKENYKNPDNGLKGKIYMSFIVETDGTLSQIKALKDLGCGTEAEEAECIRVLQKSPKWIPATQNHKKVKITYTTPISINE